MRDPDDNEPELSEGQKRVLAAAMEVFAERGFAAASTSEIAKRAGVAEGTVFRHFKTKKDLLIGAVSPLLVRWVAPFVLHKLDEVLEGPHESFEAFWRSMFANRLELVKKNGTVFRILLQEIPFHPELRQRFRTSVVEPLIPKLLAAIERFQAKGQIDPTIPPATVLRIVGSSLASYLALRTFIAPDLPYDDEREMETTIRVLMNGFAPRSAPVDTAPKAGAKPQAKGASVPPRARASEHPPARGARKK